MDKKLLMEINTRTVKKANALIQQSRFELSAQQQKMLLYLISQIEPTDKEFQLYEFDLKHFCAVCNIEQYAGKNYNDLRNAIKSIADKSLWVETTTGEETLLRWIEKPYIDKKNNKVRIRLDEDMKPFLLQLKKNYTYYELVWTLQFKSKYSIRLYELIKSIHYHELEEYEREYPLEEIQRLLNAEKYKRWQHLKEKVLEIAVREINLYSDKIVSYEPIKARGSKAVCGIRLKVKSKSGDDSLKLRVEIEQKYELNQLSLWDLERLNDGK